MEIKGRQIAKAAKPVLPNSHPDCFLPNKSQASSSQSKHRPASKDSLLGIGAR